MTPADLVAAVRERLDETERDAEEDHAPWHYTELGVFCACGAGMTDENCPVSAAVLRRVAAQRRVLERHQPHIGDDGQATCEHCPADYEDELTPWPCPEFADLADGLGIDLEEET